MKVLIIGGGLMGVLSAYFLRAHGHEVTVVDRREAVARETSFANGAMLTPSAAEPWNAPGSWRLLLASLGRSDSAMQVRLHALPTLAGWGFRFLRNSGAEAFERNTLSNIQLALYSLEAMKAVRERTRIEYGRKARGFVRIFRDQGSFNKACDLAARLVIDGLSHRPLTSIEVGEFEPALAPIVPELAGAIHYQPDESGDAYRFCVGVAEYLRRDGVDFRFGTQVSMLETRAGQVTAAVCHRERFVADKYIVAAGSYSTPLLSSVGLRLPVRPVKGYSVTLNCNHGESSLNVPVVDDRWHAVVVPLDDAIRVAGTAEFAGFDLSLPPARIQNLVTMLRNVLPRAPFKPSTAKPWCGLRPMSADGVPIIGSTPISNLLVNTGHGHLGWTMAAGSAQLLADLVRGVHPGIDPAPYALSRFQ